MWEGVKYESRIKDHPMNYAAIVLICPLCSNKVGAAFIGDKCPNPECLYQFGKMRLEKKNSVANDRRVLRMMKRVYRDATLDARGLRKHGLTDEDISELKADTRYTEPRYFRKEVIAYLRIKKTNKPKQKQLSFT